MSRWSRHVEALTRVISPLKAEVESGGLSEEGFESGAGDEVELCADAIEKALVQGMQVSLGDLEATPHGWCYRGQPVMVFAVDVTAVEDRAVRREFFHRIHLAPCCGALEDPAQAVWIGTAREQLAAPDLEQAPHVCEYCLTKVNYQGFRALPPRDRSRVAAGFSFFWHVSQYSDTYFPSDTPTFWAPGRAPQVVELSGTAEPRHCGQCHWDVPADEPWLLPAEIAGELGIDGDCCVVCAQQQATGIFALPEDLALGASQARFQNLSQAGEEGVEAGDRETGAPASWAEVRRWLPLSWHPLTLQLESRLGAPQLFQRFIGYEGTAVLAWPDYRRGIVVEESEKSSLPEGWDFWPRDQVLKSLG